MITTYSQAVDYLYRNLPMFQRIGAAALRKDLTNTLRICEAAGNPQEKFKTVHVAGTNGKGSTAHMLASVLQSAGYRTGLYTSPHLKSFTERIRIDGKEIEEQFVTDFVNETVSLIEILKPSFFEITVTMAFSYFAARNVDVAVIEVGLGGRLDSTNVIHPELSVITNIGMDHTDLLGDTMEKIAREKAGIIKAGVPAVVSERQREVSYVFEEAAEAKHTSVFFASDTFSICPGQKGMIIMKGSAVYLDEVVPDLKGNYQRPNIIGVVQAIEQLRLRGFRITDDNIRNGLQHVVDLTGLKGRWQKLRDRPATYCDTAHNPEGISYLVRQIRSQTYTNLHMVLGMTKGKDIDKMLVLLPADAMYYFCEAKLPRAVEAEMLAAKARVFGLRGVVIHDVNEAMHQALNEAAERDFVFIGGSTFVVAEIEDL